ncbi:hypothetical protein [Gluconobacter cerinus]|nr:hypothetical protein [Gluconobacter cerinus]
MARPPGRGPRAAAPLWRLDGLWLAPFSSDLSSASPDPVFQILAATL